MNSCHGTLNDIKQPSITLDTCHINIHILVHDYLYMYVHMHAMGGDRIVVIILDWTWPLQLKQTIENVEGSLAK